MFRLSWSAIRPHRGDVIGRRDRVARRFHHVFGAERNPVRGAVFQEPSTIASFALFANAMCAARIPSPSALPRILNGLPAIVDVHTERLILGSFPSVASLAAQQYYGHPQNQFWRLIGGVIGVALHQLDYATRIARVLEHRIGIWDVIASCERSGSLDSAIRNEVPNDFAALFARCPNIARVALNGGKAGRYRRVVETFGKPVVVLPSSSPANATHSFAHKLDVWREWLAIGTGPIS